MSADLHMIDDLKNTGKGNLFVIFGEPDIDILPAEGDGAHDGWIQVRVNGVDVFHSDTGEVRSDGPEGIACWFIDTDCNEASLLRPPGLLPRHQRPLQVPQDHPQSRDQPGSLGSPQQPHLPPLPQTQVRPHSRQGHQSFRRRSHEGVPDQMTDLAVNEFRHVIHIT